MSRVRTPSPAPSPLSGPDVGHASNAVRLPAAARTRGRAAASPPRGDRCPSRTRPHHRPAAVICPAADGAYLVVFGWASPTAVDDAHGEGSIVQILGRKGGLAEYLRPGRLAGKPP